MRKRKGNWPQIFTKSVNNMPAEKGNDNPLGMLTFLQAIRTICILREHGKTQNKKRKNDKKYKAKQELFFAKTLLDL